MVLPARELGKSHDSRGKCPTNRARLNPKFTPTCHGGEDRSVARLPRRPTPRFRPIEQGITFVRGTGWLRKYVGKRAVPPA